MTTRTGRRDAPTKPLHDLATLVRMVRAVSREIVLEKLLEEVLTLALEHGGLERGMFVLSRDGAHRVAAEATLVDGAVDVRSGEDCARPGEVPDAVLDAVVRSRELLLLHDAGAQEPFATDRALRRRRARSVLCLPLAAGGQLQGALYLEHRAPHVLTPDRVELLELLAAQAAVALRQAHLVAELQQASQRARRRDGELELHDLRKLLEVVPQQIFVLRADLTMEYANHAVLDYHGEGLTAALFSKDLDRRDRALHHPDDLLRLQDDGGRTLTRGLPLETEGRLLGTDGAYRWFLIRINPLLDEAGRVVRWYGTRTDIDDRKRSEERVRQDERELRMVVDFVPELLVVLDAQGRILYANRAALEYTGRTLEEITTIDDVWPLIFHPDDMPSARATLRGLAEGIASEVELRIRRRDGEYRWYLARNAALRDDAGRILRWFATGTDIDDRRRAEQRTQAENLALREEVDKASMFEEIVGVSPTLRVVLTSVSRVAPTDSTVLVTGETGTGKELIARAIHKRSQRASRAFVSVNCAAIPPALIASELFGHEKGAFTGALQRRAGRFELADGGTIFLDEIGDLTPDTQLALLRVLQERELERLGSTRPIKVDVRVIAATNRDLEAAMQSGAFRSDLYYRLNVFPIELPPLRERAADIPLLVAYFADRFASRNGKTIGRVDKPTLDLIQSYGWPGNVRELQNVIERAVIVSESDTLAVDPRWLSSKSAGAPSAGAASAPPRALADELAVLERKLIESALAESGGRVSGPTGAAEKLGIPSSTLESKIRALGIGKHRFKGR